MITQVPIQLLLVGVWYPLILNRGGTMPTWSWLARSGSPVLALVCSGAGYAIVVAGGRATAGLGLLAVVLGINGAVSTLAWYDALWLAARGDAIWNAGVAAPANAVACLLLLVLIPVPAAPFTIVTAMSAALVVGNLGLLVMIRAGDRLHRRAGHVPSAHEIQSGGAAWYFARASSSYGVFTALQAFSLGLAASATTIINIVMRVVAGFTTASVHVVLPRLVHVETDHPEEAYRFLRWLLHPMLVGSLTLVAVAPFTASHSVAYLALGLGWTFGAVCNAGLHRVSFRFLPATTSMYVVGTSLAVLAGIGVYEGVGHLTIFVIIVAFAALELVPAALMALRLGRPALAVECAVVAFASLVPVVV
jgi:hypothetical protein